MTTMWTSLKVVTLVLCCVLLADGQVVQRGFEVTIENLSGGSILPTALSEVVYAVYTTTNPLFTVGQVASSGLRNLAENADGTTLYNQTMSSTNTLSAGLVTGGVPAVAGFVGPNGIPIGGSVNFGIRGRVGDMFSFVTQFWESNDAFYGPASVDIPLFDSNGLPVTGTFDAVLYDAGTEVSEPPGAGINQTPRQNGSSTTNATGNPITVQALSTLYPPASTVIRVTITAAVMFTVHLENIGNGTAFSPPAWAVATVPNVFFTPGTAASAGLKNLAQYGVNSNLIAEASAKANVLFTGSGSTQPIVPGTFAEWQVPGVAGSVLYIAFMYASSNDRFWASPASGIPLFTASGPLSNTMVTDITLFDAGTAQDQAPGQRTGIVATNSTVKDALYGNPDGFIYQPTATTVRLSITPVVDSSGYSSTTPNQNVYVSFAFDKMIQA